MDTTPHTISGSEWGELLADVTLRDALAVEPKTTAGQLASVVYGVKFHFVSGSPGYVGDLFIIQGNHLTGFAPLSFLRADDGRLELRRYEGFVVRAA